MKLEYVESLALAHPFIKGFEQVSYCLTDEEARAVAQGEISEAIAKRKKEDIEGAEGGSAVYSTTFYIGLVVEPRQRTSSPIPVCVVIHRCLSEAGSVGPRRLDISYPTTEFTKLVKMWEKFDENEWASLCDISEGTSSCVPLLLRSSFSPALSCRTTSSMRASDNLGWHRSAQIRRCVNSMPSRRYR